MSLRITPLHPEHVALNARLVSYAGWEMPVSYPIGTVAEVKACRTSAGIFDVSHMGELVVAGEHALAFLQRITSNDVSRLTPGHAQYSMLLNDEGCVIDDIIVYRHGADLFLVVVNAACLEKDRDWILRQALDCGIFLSDESSRTALIAVQGPAAVELVAEQTTSHVRDLQRFQFRQGHIADASVTFSRTGYTGEDGFELFCPSDAAERVWRLLTDAGATPCGLAARDVLRLEAAYPLYGHELDDKHTPAESGTGWATRIAKEGFIGSDALILQRRAGIKDVLIGLAVVDPPNAIVRDGHPIFAADGETAVGAITSGTLSPTLGKGIAMARVARQYSKLGLSLIVQVRDRQVVAEVVKVPFYRNGV